MEDINSLFHKFFWRLLWVSLLVVALFTCSDNGNKSKKMSNSDSDDSGVNSEYGADTQGGQGGNVVDPAVIAENSKYEVVVYKSPTCGCCQSWIDVMQGLGYRLTVHSDDKLVWKMKQALQVEPTMQSCHTATVEGYVLEGHIHPDSIARLLKERPKVRGLYLPGMVPNSVGMEQPGTKPIRYSILALDYNNQKKIYDTYQ